MTNKINTMNKLVRMLKKVLFNRCIEVRDPTNQHVLVISESVTFIYKFHYNKLTCIITNLETGEEKTHKDYLASPHKFIATHLAVEEKYGRFHRSELEKLIFEYT